ncbi:MAG: Fur family transcriptional regulator, partial [Ktedonobacteraceae bacterium]
MRRRGQARKLIVELIQNLPQGTHLTASEVYEQVKKRGLDLSLSTVYRTLGMLKAEGIVTSLSGEHGSRYEAHDEEHDHDHLICLSCGFTVEFVDDLLKGFGQVLAKKNGYEFKRSQFDLYGLCQECQSKSEQFKIRQAVGTLRDVDEQLDKIEGLIRTSLAHFEARKIDKGRDSMESLIKV